jgi:hypothetical protein
MPFGIDGGERIRKPEKYYLATERMGYEKRKPGKESEEGA